LWSAFPGGPDWMKEPAAALEYLDLWRAGILDSEDSTPIFQWLLCTDGPAAGVGAHLANDILFLQAIHPDTPAVVLCRDEMYSSLRAFFPVFMAQWISDDFKRRCGGTANSVNPLEFNYTSNTNFIASKVHCFRRKVARVPQDLYNKYQSQGYFDENHIIGDVFEGPWTPLDVSYKEVLVFHQPQKRYHVFRAKLISFADIASAGYQTTVGVASFREVLSNKINIDQALQNLRPGRPKKRTKFVGRPRKATTHKKLEKMQKSIRQKTGAGAAALEEDDKENEMDIDEVPLTSTGRMT
ncbi:hypothetical protein DFH06DRAFT_1371405, partial [Mycena polygramma]